MIYSAVIAFLINSVVLAQTPPTSRFTNAMVPTTMSRLTIDLVRNRSRTFAGTVAGNATTYLYANSSDLKGLSPQQVLQRLTPPKVTADSGIRRQEIVIDLDRPLTLQTRDPVHLGTAVVDHAVRRLEVNTFIHTRGVKIVATH